MIIKTFGLMGLAVNIAKINVYLFSVLCILHCYAFSVEPEFILHRSPTVPNVQVGGSASVGCVTVRRGGPGRSVIVTREGPRRRPVAQWQGRVTVIIFLYACIHVFIQFKNAFYFQKAKYNYIICF